jgi:hypothetical protein
VLKLSSEAVHYMDLPPKADAERVNSLIRFTAGKVRKFL